MRSRQQGILPYRIEVVASGEGLTSHAGLPLVSETMRALGLEQIVAEQLHLQQRNSGLTDYQKLESVVLLLAAGGDCYDDMRVLQADQGLQRLLGYSLPSPDSVRAFCNAFHDPNLIEQARVRRAPGATAFIVDESELLQALGAINVALCHALAARGTSRRATLDHDATIIESHKQAALPHYKGGRGFQPAAVYWAEQDVVIADEYRDGNVPAAMCNLPLIRHAFASLPKSITQYFLRADSACYEQRVLRWLADEHRVDSPQGYIGFTISADMTRELHELCCSVPQEQWQWVDDQRADETVHCAELEFTPGDWPKDAKPMRYVAVRIRKRQGLLFASGCEQKFLAVVSNRFDKNAVELLRWHWEKAGTIEHIHDVSKNELGAGTPPSSPFGANAAWYRISLITYNILSAMKALALPSDLSSARPKKLRFALFNLAGKIASHAGDLILRISDAAERLVGLLAARARLLALVPATS
jgi:hypothetical protein